MSIGNGIGSDGMTVRSPSSKANSNQRDMEDIELGSSRRLLKAKDSNIVELAPLATGKGDSSKSLSSPRGGVPPNDKDSSSVMKSLIASSMYSGCSVGMVLVNKSLASR